MCDVIVHQPCSKGIISSINKLKFKIKFVKIKLKIKIKINKSKINKALLSNLEIEVMSFRSA